MGLERFLTKKSERSDGDEGDEKIDLGRRKALGGLAALAAAAILPKETYAADLPELESLPTLEARERNVEEILRYATWLKVKEKDLANAKTAEEIEEIIFHDVPALNEHVIEGTELDVKEFIGDAATLLSYTNSQGVRKNANSFTVKHKVISVSHVIKGNFEGCTIDENGLEIAGCSLDNTSVVPDEETRREREENMLGFDDEQKEKNLHGEIAFVSAKRKLSNGSEITELIPAVLVKITPNFFYEEGNEQTFFNEKNTKNYRNQLSCSYLAVVAPMDYDRNTSQTAQDIKGVSGSPLITYEDCRNNKKNASGVEWGAQPRKGRSIMFVFGPDVLGNFLEQMEEAGE